jgi:hypothetical protein
VRPAIRQHSKAFHPDVHARKTEIIFYMTKITTVEADS